MRRTFPATVCLMDVPSACSEVRGVVNEIDARIQSSLPPGQISPELQLRCVRGAPLLPAPRVTAHVVEAALGAPAEQPQRKRRIGVARGHVSRPPRLDAIRNRPARGSLECGHDFEHAVAGPVPRFTRVAPGRRGSAASADTWARARSTTWT